MILIRHILTGVLGTVCLGLTVPVTAQSSSIENNFVPKGTQARVTLKIPFGVKPKNSKQKARLHFGVRQYYDLDRSNEDSLKPINTPRYKESSLSLSLEQNPQFFIGNQAIIFNDVETAQVSDGVKIGGGVIAGAVVIVGGAALLLLLNPADDDG